MSDLHHLPLMGHDLPTKPAVRAKVFRRGRHWYWGYQGSKQPFWHGPFTSWAEAYASARRTMEDIW